MGLYRTETVQSWQSTALHLQVGREGGAVLQKNARRGSSTTVAVHGLRRRHRLEETFLIYLYDNTAPEIIWRNSIVLHTNDTKRIRFDPETVDPIIRYFSTLHNPLPDTLINEVDDWLMSLSQIHHRALIRWVIGGPKIRDRQEGLSDLRQQIQTFNEAMSNAPIFYGNVFRGLRGLSKRTIKCLSESDELTVESNTGFSATEEHAMQFTNGFSIPNYPFTPNQAPIESSILEIIGNGSTPTGRVLQTAEQEVIIAKGTRFKIRDRQVTQFEEDCCRVLHITLEQE